LGKNDALFVSFAGHGDQIKSGRNEIGYLIPHDGQVGRLSSVISMADLRDTVSNAIPAKHIFYVVDACYGGLLTATRSIDKSPRRDLAYLKEIAQEPVRQLPQPRTSARSPSSTLHNSFVLPRRLPDNSGFHRMPVQRAYRNHPNRQIAQQENNGSAALMAETTFDTNPVLLQTCETD